MLDLREEILKSMRASPASGLPETGAPLSIRRAAVR